MSLQRVRVQIVSFWYSPIPHYETHVLVLSDSSWEDVEAQSSTHCFPKMYFLAPSTPHYETHTWRVWLS